MLLALSACSTPGTRPIADSACTAFARLTYAIPPVQSDGTRNMANDPGNARDTTETVEAIQGHNARYRATCPEN